MPTPAFRSINESIGWGEPDGIWFVGLEEAIPWEERHAKEEILAYYQDRDRDCYLPYREIADEPWPRAGRDIRLAISTVARMCSRSWSHLTPEEWRDSRLYMPGCGIFQSNLFPLGKPRRRDWPAHFERLFGFSKSERERYETEVKNTRFGLIGALWQKHSPRGTVCFGKEGWPHFRTIFELEQETEIAIAPGIYSYNSKRIVLCPFFAYGHMDSAKIGAVAKQFHEWGVQIQ